MKYKGQGKKAFIVMIFDDYLNVYRAFSKAVTINQAIWILRDKPRLNLTIQKITPSN